MLHGTEPTPLKAYVLVPGAAGALCGAGAGFIAIAGSLPPTAAAFCAMGVGMVAAGTGVLVVAQAVASERAEFWKYRTAVVQREVTPTAAPAAAQPGELIYTQRGPALLDRERAVLRYIKGARKGYGRQQQAAGYTSTVDVIGRIIVDESTTESVWIDVAAGLHRFAQYGGDDPNISTAEGDWTGKGKPFSLAEFRYLRDWMIGERLAEWNNPRAAAEKQYRGQGWHLLPRTHAICKRLKGTPAPKEKRVEMRKQNIS